MDNKQKRNGPVGRVKRKRRPSRFLRERILVEAQLLAKRATNGGFTIVELSKVVGISPSTIYDHFESKLELERTVDSDP